MRIRQFLGTSPVYSLYLAHDRVVRSFQDELALEGVHFVQALILTGIFFEERGVRPHELADTLGCSRSNVSHAIRGLERQGWLERSIHPRDARAYLLTLTKTGRKKASRLIKIFDAAEDRLERHGASALTREVTRFVSSLGHQTL